MRSNLRSWSLCVAGFIGVSCNNTQFGAKEAQVRRKTGLPEADANPTTIQQEFSVSSLKDGKVTFDFRHKWLEETIELQSRYDDHAQIFHQNDRMSYSKAFKQGISGTETTEEFSQIATGILDIVVVVDNSASMQEEQDNLSTKLAPLLQAVKNSDWKLNVVTTDPANGCTRGGVISRNDANASSAFQAAVTAGTGGSGNERGILQAVNALRCNQITDFPRPKSSIAVLIVADEDNCSSNGLDCSTSEWNTPVYLTNFLKNDLGRVLGTDARVYGIFWHPDTTCATGYNKAVQYAQAVASTSGVYGTICSMDYTPTLNKISEDIATILKSEFNLSMTPDPASVVVRVNDIETNTGWSLVGKTLTFTDIPPASAKIKVSYKTGATPIRTRFDLERAPALATLTVKVNGVVSDVTGYSVDPMTNELVFTTAPAEAAEITVNFRADTELLTEFDLMADVIPNSAVVKINGLETLKFAIVGNRKLQLMSPPPDAAKIEISYQSFGGKIFEYPLNVIGKSYDSMTVLDKATSEPVVASYSNGVLTIDPQDHRDGREVTIRYRNDAPDLGFVELQHKPEPDSIKLMNAPDDCRDSFKVEEKKVSFTCDDDADKPIELSYRYRGDTISSFILAGVTQPDSGVWEVLVNGVPTLAYERSGSMITLKEAPVSDAKVKLIWKSGI